MCMDKYEASTYMHMNKQQWYMNIMRDTLYYKDSLTSEVHDIIIIILFLIHTSLLANSITSTPNFELLHNYIVFDSLCQYCFKNIPIL